MKKIVKWCAAAVFVGALAGCARTAPIAQVHSIVSAGHTADQVKNGNFESRPKTRLDHDGNRPGND